MFRHVEDPGGFAVSCTFPILGTLLQALSGRLYVPSAWKSWLGVVVTLVPSTSTSNLIGSAAGQRFRINSTACISPETVRGMVRKEFGSARWALGLRVQFVTQNVAVSAVCLTGIWLCVASFSSWSSNSTPHLRANVRFEVRRQTAKSVDVPPYRPVIAMSMLKLTLACFERRAYHVF